jgi:O-antigen/teichoic acid export membrane protein
MDLKDRSTRSGERRWATAHLESLVPSLFAGAWNWARLIGEPAGISGTAVVLTLLANLILFRTLSPTDAGRLTLLFAVLQTTLLIGTLGQPSLIVRTYSREVRGHFNWKRDLLNSASLSIPLIVVVSLLSQAIYTLSVSHTLFVMVGASAFAILTNASFILSSQQLYVWAIPILRWPNALLILPAAAFAVAPELAKLKTVLASNLLSIGLIAVLSLVLLSRLVPAGIASITLRSRMRGLAFLASSSSSLIPEQGLVVIAGTMIAPEGLAVYAALAILLRGFEFLADVISRVLATELLRRQSPDYTNLTIGLGGLALLLGAAALVAAPIISRWVYDGRYDHGVGLIGWLVLAGVFRLTETLPRGYLIGHATDELLGKVISVRILIGLGGAALGAALISNLGLVGLVSSRALIYLARSVAGYYYFRRIRTGASPPIDDAE